MLEKRGEINEGWTPPETLGAELEEHLTKRAADQVAGCRQKCACFGKLGQSAQACCCSKCSCDLPAKKNSST